MDETGFRIGEGKSQKVVPASPISFTETGRHSESITAIECIAADGWKTLPWFLVKAQYHRKAGILTKCLTIGRYKDKEEVNPLRVEVIIEGEIVGVETEIEDISDEVGVDALVGE